MKTLFPNTDRTLIPADLAGLELRIAATTSQQPHIDIHSATAADMFGVHVSNVTVEQRNAAKARNYFGLYSFVGPNLLDRTPTA